MRGISHRIRHKNREPLIEDVWRADFHAYIGGIVRNRKGDLLAAGGMADHQHLLARIPADSAIADLVRDIISISSGWRRERDDRAFAWQNGSGAFTASASMVETVMAYINDRPYHHRKNSFREESIGLLKNRGVECDEKYLWK